MDAAKTLLDQLDDPALFEKEEAVPVFDAHDEHDPAGNLVRRFDRPALEKLAEKNNARLEQTGDLAPVTIGHTRDKLPETEQPPLVGWARNYRVEPFGPKGKLALVCDLFMRADKGGKKLLQDYPRRSIELWRDGTIDPISICIRTPRRDLGVTYQRGGQTVTRYSYEESGMDDLPMTPAAGADDLDPAFKANADKYMGQCYPNLSAMHEKYSADLAPAAGPAMPGAGNTALPGDKPAAPDPTLPPVPDDGPDRMSRDSAAVQYRRVRDELEAARAEIAAIKFQRSQAVSEQLVIQLEAEGYLIPSREKEVGRMAQLDDAGRTERAAEIRTCYQRAPIGGGFLRLAADPTAKPAGTTREQRDQAVSLASRKGISFDDALTQIRGA